MVFGSPLTEKTVLADVKVKAAQTAIAKADNLKRQRGVGDQMIYKVINSKSIINLIKDKL